jgi:hypothetical protein
MRVAEFEDGRYVLFVCPGCKRDHVIPVKNHPNAWEFNGDYNRPSLRPSILSNSGRADPDSHICHSFVTDGKIQFLSDSTHELAGMTVELPEMG